MKKKTLTQIWSQLERIKKYYNASSPTTNIERCQKAEKICSRYGCNMVDWMRSRMSLPELDAYYAVTGVPMKVYTKIHKTY